MSCEAYAHLVLWSPWIDSGINTLMPQAVRDCIDDEVEEFVFLKSTGHGSTWGAADDGGLNSLFCSQGILVHGFGI